MRFIELCHTVVDGTVTFPGNPPVVISDYISLSEMREKFGEAGSLLDQIYMINTSGTYLDAPAHRFESGYYIADIPLEKLVDLPLQVVYLPDGKECFEAAELSGVGIRGGAVLLCTGQSAKFNTPEYGIDAPYLSVEGAQYLVDRGVVFVGIDGPLIDKINSGSCPVHDIILGAEAVVCENMTNLEALSGVEGALLTAVPPQIRMASLMARVYAKVSD